MALKKEYDLHGLGTDGEYMKRQLGVNFKGVVD